MFNRRIKPRLEIVPLYVSYETTDGPREVHMGQCQVYMNIHLPEELEDLIGDGKELLVGESVRPDVSDMPLVDDLLNIASKHRFCVSRLSGYQEHESYSTFGIDYVHYPRSGDCRADTYWILRRYMPPDRLLPITRKEFRRLR